MSVCQASWIWETAEKEKENQRRIAVWSAVPSLCLRESDSTLAFKSFFNTLKCGRSSRPRLTTIGCCAESYTLQWQWFAMTVTSYSALIPKRYQDAFLGWGSTPSRWEAASWGQHENSLMWPLCLWADEAHALLICKNADVCALRWKFAYLFSQFLDDLQQ